MPRRFDAIVIGAGQAGPPLAARLVAAGRTVALIERDRVGGTCVNTGCTPTKAMVASARAAQRARRAAELGVTIDGVAVDLARVTACARAIAEQSRDGLESFIAGTQGLTLIRGHARFASAHAVSVAGQSYEAPEIFINVGGRARIPDYPGVADIAPLTNSTILDLQTLPRHLVIVGGGYIGLEFAQMFARFGSRVTLVERGDRLIKKEDVSTSAAVRQALEAEGVAMRLGADCIGFSHGADGPMVKLDCGQGAPEIEASHVLLAVGRRPNTDDLGLDAAGIATNERGYVTVNDALETNVSGVWALGDCNGRGAFTHTAYNDFEIVAEALLDGRRRSVADRIPAYALYTDPPLGRVGLTIAQAREKGHRVLVGERPMSRVGRAREKGETTGFMRLVVDADSDAILGGAIFGTGGDEAIHAIVVAMQAGGTWRLLKDTVAIHPTISELLPTLAGELRAVKENEQD